MKSFVDSHFSTIVSAVTVATLLLGGALVEAAAAKAVQCTEYVAIVKSLPKTYPAACLWTNGYLKNNGYKQQSAPQSGAVIVFQTNAGHGVDTKNGHVGVIRAVTAVKDNKGVVTRWSVTVRGANQDGKMFTDNGCSNVSDIVFNIYKTETMAISYWSK